MKPTITGFALLDASAHHRLPKATAQRRDFEDQTVARTQELLARRPARSQPAPAPATKPAPAKPVAPEVAALCKGLSADRLISLEQAGTVFAKCPTLDLARAFLEASGVPRLAIDSRLPIECLSLEAHVAVELARLTAEDLRVAERLGQNGSRLMAEQRAREARQ